MNKRRTIEVERDITEPWLNIIDEMVQTGKLIAILEIENDKTTARKVKNLIFKHIEDIREFNKTTITPIRQTDHSKINENELL